MLPDSVVSEHLRAYGEGPWTLVFGVADIDTERSRVLASGGEWVPYGRPPPAVLAHYAVAREARVGQLGDLTLVLGEFALPDPSGS